MIPFTAGKTIWDELPESIVDVQKLEHLFESRAKDMITKVRLFPIVQYNTPSKLHYHKATASTSYKIHSKLIAINSLLMIYISTF